MHERHPFKCNIFSDHKTTQFSLTSTLQGLKAKKKTGLEFHYQSAQHSDILHICFHAKQRNKQTIVNNSPVLLPLRKSDWHNSLAQNTLLPLLLYIMKFPSPIFPPSVCSCSLSPFHITPSYSSLLFYFPFLPSQVKGLRDPFFRRVPKPEE